MSGELRDFGVFNPQIPMLILLLNLIVYPYVVVHYTQKSVAACGFVVSITPVKLNDPEVYADIVIQFYEIEVENALPE